MKEGRTLEAYDAVAFITKELDTKETIIEGGILPQDSIAIVGGRSKVGKSIFVLNMAIQMATAKPFLLQFNITKPQRVIYLQAEISEQSMQNRLRKMVDAIGNNLSEQMLYIVNRKGFKLDGQEDLEKIDDLIKKCEAKVLIVDPLYKFHTGDENLVKDMTHFFDNLDWLITQNGISIVLVHHFGKPSENKGGATRFRGSTTITDYADTYMMLDRKSKDRSRNFVKLSFELRNDEEPETMILYRNPDTLWYELEGVEGNSKVSIHDCLECLEQLGGVVKGKDRLISAIREKTKSSDRTVKKKLGEAEGSKKILTIRGKGKGSPLICYLPSKKSRAEQIAETGITQII